jgi:hypothetical protein
VRGVKVGIKAIGFIFVIRISTSLLGVKKEEKKKEERATIPPGLWRLRGSYLSSDPRNLQRPGGIVARSSFFFSSFFTPNKLEIAGIR